MPLDNFLQGNPRGKLLEVFPVVACDPLVILLSQVLGTTPLSEEEISDRYNAVVSGLENHTATKMWGFAERKLLPTSLVEEGGDGLFIPDEISDLVKTVASTAIVTSVEVGHPLVHLLGRDMDRQQDPPDTASYATARLLWSVQQGLETRYNLSLGTEIDKANLNRIINRLCSLDILARELEGEDYHTDNKRKYQWDNKPDSKKDLPIFWPDRKLADAIYGAIWRRKTGFCALHPSHPFCPVYTKTTSTTSKIVFNSGMGIWTLEEATGFKELLIPGRSHVAPSWSLNGRKIAFYEDIIPTREIWTMNQDGTQPTPIVSVPGLLYESPAYASNNELVFHEWLGLFSLNGELKSSQSTPGAPVLNLLASPTPTGDFFPMVG